MTPSHPFQLGELRFVMAQHKGPIFSLKWNRDGNLILSGSADASTVVWDPETGEMKQHFELHSRKSSNGRHTSHD